MRFRPAWVFLIVTACALPLFAQQVSVPFVGCVMFGQAQRLEAPKGSTRSVPIRREDARKLAWYEAGNGIALLAPRGWYCVGNSGSGGWALYLSPQPFGNGPQPGGFQGPAIEFDHISGENSGRYQIAEMIERLFPAYKSWATQTLEQIELPVPTGPFKGDSLRYVSRKIVEYKTSAQADGLGTHSTWLKKNDSAVSGVVILLYDPPDIGSLPGVLQLSMRLPPDLARLAPAIVRQIERETPNRK